MLRILLLVLVGFIVAAAALRTIATIVVFVIDMKNGGQHAPEILGTMTGSLVITLGLGWVWKKIYLSKRGSATSPKP
jgi:hypothetical protein